MMTNRQMRRGQPVVALGILAVIWICVRMMTWSPIEATSVVGPDPGEPMLARGSQPHQEGRQIADADADAASADVGVTIDVGVGRDVASEAVWAIGPAATDRRSPVASPWQTPLPSQTPLPARPDQPIMPTASQSGEIAVGHQLLWSAALARMPGPAHSVFAARGSVVGGAAIIPAKGDNSASRDRWSLDAWAFWRQGSSSLTAAQGRAPTYGASQAAAVLRYRLTPNDPRDLQLYARAYKALITGGEEEVATGLDLVPIPGLPLRAHGELRVTRTMQGTSLRPAAFVSTAIAPMSVRPGLSAEAYGQAGYVGGAYATPFADGQLHLLQNVGDFDLGKVSVGAGAWGGVQEGSNRLDIGPTMRMDLHVGATPARLSVDWRERIGGDADPDSGVAITLSARF